MENLVALNKNELTIVNGGHNKEAYEAGVWLGRQARLALSVYGLIALCL